MTPTQPHPPIARRGRGTAFASASCRSFPVMPGMFAFAAAVGATSARKGLSLAETVLMNITVYAGASQLVALEVWPERVTFAAMAALALITAIVNARMLLMGASLQPWLGGLPAWHIYPLLHLITDPGWLVAMRYRSEGGNDVSRPARRQSRSCGSAGISSAITGFLLGSLIADPRAVGLDLVMPIFFSAMLIPLWRGSRRAVAWVVAGAVALAVQYLSADGGSSSPVRSPAPSRKDGAMSATEIVAVTAILVMAAATIPCGPAGSG